MRALSIVLLFVLSVGLIAACGGSPTAAAPVPTAAVAVGETSASENPTAVANEPTAIGKLNLNTATSDELLAIEGMSNRMVREFEEYRPYVSIVQFRREIGKYVSEDVVAGYEQYVFVPVDANEADAETLQQLPGVDESIAAELMAARPFAASSDFLTTLATYVSADQAAQATAYLAAP